MLELIDKTIVPLTGKILVQPIETRGETPGGIIIPDSAKKKSQRGKVVNIGGAKILDDGTIRNSQVKKGDVILFTDYAGVNIEIDDKEYLIMEEQEILAIIK